MENKIIVYAKLNENNEITELQSSIHLQEINGWIKIDEGESGDKYAHPQGNYFDIENGEKPLRDSQGRCNYKLIDDKPVELTDEEKESLFHTPVQQPTEQQILNAKLLQDNANMQLELEEQKKLNAQILLQIAGGSTNA